MIVFSNISITQHTLLCVYLFVCSNLHARVPVCCVCLQCAHYVSISFDARIWKLQSDDVKAAAAPVGGEENERKKNR